MICLFILTQLTNVTDTQTDRHHMATEHRVATKKITETQIQGVSQKVVPIKLFGIFSLRLSLLREILQICWKFISTYICQFLCIYVNISSNGIYFSMSTHRFHRVKFWVLNADALWEGLGEKAITSSYTQTKGESWALLRKSAVESTTMAQPFCVNQAVGLGDLPQRLHVQFVIVRQFSHW